jgi:hypothetical protein
MDEEQNPDVNVFRLISKTVDVVPRKSAFPNRALMAADRDQLLISRC